MATATQQLGKAQLSLLPFFICKAIPLVALRPARPHLAVGFRRRLLGEAPALPSPQEPPTSPCDAFSFLEEKSERCLTHFKSLSAIYRVVWVQPSDEPYKTYDIFRETIKL
ncbi:hypothetical protein K432DRAFT_411565 [Lepidopterella palustris CBS 459.81]|uniref:Uncharacterized protein n=1 Tax=Lepidopterella palustris CBS 459.81 TaxID=1314670 RepID=A0A8E2DWA5_9PEZI|nr:hypothetical protein K432DRAFT_411565 [Lepidopterella palustris CBS 459.81]